jgi:hypothetical protein
MTEGLQGTMITGGVATMIDVGLILIMTVAGTGKTEDATIRTTVMMIGRPGATGMRDGPGAGQTGIVERRPSVGGGQC